MTSPKDELKAIIAAGNAVIVAGTGVSVAAVGGKEPLVTWKGLLLDGLSQCKDGKIVQAMIEALNGSPSLDDFLMAATTVETTLGKAKRTKWLNSCLGGLQPLNTEVIEAIGALNSPILTTNYDTLIAKTLKRDAVAWTNAEQLGEVARGDAGHVLHLHGVYTEADSVVLGWCSYTKVADHAPSTLLKGALGLMKSFVFIGCGVDGLTDPDLGPFFATYGAIFDGGRHFRICHKDEAATPHGITAITYENHADLPGLLRSLAPPAKPALASPRPAYRLERAPEHFVGRGGERDVLVARLLAAEPTLVTGPAGMGKSALCLAALHHPEVAAQYGERRWFIRLDGATTTATMMAMVGEALGLPADMRRAEAVRHALAQSPGALVLDNFETTWHGDEKEAEAELAQLRALPGLALAVGVRGGGGLPAPCPPWQELAVNRLGAADALDLFQCWTNHRFDGDADQAVLVDETKGWPLALVLLAREAASLPRLAKLLERWHEARSKAQDEIGAAVEVSLGSPRMTADAHILAGLLGRLPDGVAVADLDIILPDRGEEAGGVLVGIGLAQWSESRDRLLTLAPIRQHLERAHSPAEADWAPCRDHYLGLAAAADGSPSGTVFARLTSETGNLATAIALALEDPATAPAAVMAALGFGEFYRFTGLGEAVPLLRHAAEQGLGDRATAHCLLPLGVIAMERGEPEAAALLEEARRLFAGIRARVGEGNCLTFLGDLTRGQGRWAEAEAHYAQAEAAFRRRAPLGIAQCRKSRGELTLFQGRVAEAIPLFRDALKRYRRLGNELGQGNALLQLAECAQRQGRIRQASIWLQQAVPHYQAAGDILGEANCHSVEAGIALAGGKVDEGLASIGRAQPLYERIGAPLGQGNCWLCRGRCAVQQGDVVVARRHYVQALQFYARIPDPKSMAMVKADMAAIAKGKERKTLFAEPRAAYGKLGLEEFIQRIDSRFPDLAPKA